MKFDEDFYNLMKRGTLKLKLICKFVAQLYSVHCTVKDPVIS